MIGEFMTVRELIQLLQGHSKDDIVIVQGCDCDQRCVGVERIDDVGDTDLYGGEEYADDEMKKQKVNIVRIQSEY